MGFNEDRVKSGIEQWDLMKESIQQAYDDKNKEAIGRMEVAVALFMDIVSSGEESGYSLWPLNGEDRLAFIRKKLSSPAAFVQMDALFTELKKKAARQRALLDKEG